MNDAPQNNTTIKAVIFDCFGVILGDAKQVRLSKLDQTDPEKARQVRDLFRAADKGFLSGDEVSRQADELFGLEPGGFRAEQNNLEVPNTELLEYINSLKDRFKTGMLSNISSRERLDMRFTEGQLDKTFDVVVASGDEGYVKPQPEIYKIMADKLGVQTDECVMIDDIADFCEGALEVGMQAIQYTSNQQAIADLNQLIDRNQI